VSALGLGQGGGKDEDSFYGYYLQYGLGCHINRNLQSIWSGPKLSMTMVGGCLRTDEISKE